MNTRNLLVSSLMLVCVVLSACAPAATPTQAPTTMPQPTDIPPTQTPIVAVGSVVDLSLVPDISNGIETISVDFLNNRGPLQAFDSIWFLSDTEGKVTRWNPETRQVLATIAVGYPGKAPYGDPVSAVATSDAVWITSVGTHEIVKVDPQTNQIVDRIALPKVSGDQELDAVVYMVLVGNTAWVLDYAKDIAQGIDLNTKQAAGTFTNVKFISGLDGSLWISDIKGVSQIDPETSQVVKQLPTGSPLPVVSADGSVWGFDNAIFRMDPQTFQVIAKIKLGGPVRSLAFAFGSLWATVTPNPPACHNGSYLVRIDPKTYTAISKTKLDCPFDIFPYTDSLWMVSDSSLTKKLLTNIQP